MLSNELKLHISKLTLGPWSCIFFQSDVLSQRKNVQFLAFGLPVNDAFRVHTHFSTESSDLSPTDAGAGHLPGTGGVMGDMGELSILVAAMGGG